MLFACVDLSVIAPLAIKQRAAQLAIQGAHVLAFVSVAAAINYEASMHGYFSKQNVRNLLINCCDCPLHTKFVACCIQAHMYVCVQAIQWHIHACVQCSSRQVLITAAADLPTHLLRS